MISAQFIPVMNAVAKTSVLPQPWCVPKLRLHSHGVRIQLRPKMNTSPQIKVQASLENQEPKRRSANYAPSVWGDFFLAYASHSAKENVSKEQEREYERLKEEVRKMVIKPCEESWKKLDLIDSIQRLGVSYHFESEIEALVPSMLEQDENDNDLYAVALRFWILRQLGHNVCSDVFKKFKDLEGKFRESNVRGLLSFYEATHFRVHDEVILEDALIFTTAQLQSKLPNLDNFLRPRVKLALEMPIQKTVTKIGAIQFLSLYEQDRSHDENLLNFAKLEFNFMQRLYQKELSVVTQWWKGIDCPKKYPFARDRVVECYLSSVVLHSEPKYSFTRTAATKLAALTTILDDMYDVHGTLDELILFTDAIERWHISAIDHLPLYMKDYYRSLLDVCSEMEEMLAKYGKSNHLNYAISAFKDLARAYLEEARWVHSGYVPNFEEYMKVALVSGSAQIGITYCLVCMGECVTEDVLDWVSTNPLIVRAATLIGRLRDDMATYKAEKERGEVASAIECYMQQYGASEEETFVEFEKSITNAWKDSNQEYLKIGPKNSVVPMFILELILDSTKASNVAYAGGRDWYSNPSTKTKDLVASLLVHPIPL